MDDPVYKLRAPEEPDFRPRSGAREPAPAASPAPRHPARRLLLDHLPLETETTVFVLVNLLDFFVTYWLLMVGDVGERRFIESNPIARYFIESWGPVKGMLGFKLAVVTLVCVISQLIALERPVVARGVLLFGTLATGCVVAYSVSLYISHG